MVWDHVAKNSLCPGDQSRNANRKMVEWQLSEVVLHCLSAQIVFSNDTSISCKDRFRLSIGVGCLFLILSFLACLSWKSMNSWAVFTSDAGEVSPYL